MLWQGYVGEGRGDLLLGCIYDFDEQHLKGGMIDDGLSDCVHFG
jgi:hypothetical protein